MSHLRRFMIIFGGIFLLMSALNIVRFFAQRSDIWWTPQALSVPLAEASDRVRVYLDDVALREHINAGRLQLTTDQGAVAVAESDVRLRFNNWDRIRAQGLPVLIGYAVCLGASGVFLMFGLLGWGPAKGVKQAE